MAKNDKKLIAITLPTPFEKDGEEIKSVNLRKPDAGDLRGLNLMDVMQMNFEAHQTLLTRISPLNERDLLNMPVENFVPLQTEIAGFFVDMKESSTK